MIVVVKERTIGTIHGHERSNAPRTLGHKEDGREGQLAQMPMIRINVCFHSPKFRTGPAGRVKNTPQSAPIARVAAVLGSAAVAGLRLASASCATVTRQF